MSGYKPWAVGGMLGGAVTSIAANMAHVFVPPVGWPDGQEWRPEIGAVIGAVVWPLFLLLASEVLSRKRWASAWSRTLGTLATLVVGAVAAVISYQHLHGLLLHYRESVLSAVIGPLAVDGLMIVCSVALVARDADTVRSPEPLGRVEVPAPEPAPRVEVPGPVSVTVAAPEPDRAPVAAARLERGVTVTVPAVEDGPADQGRTAEALLPLVQAAIRAGDLPSPTAEAIRKHLRCAPATARQVRDLIRATA